MACDHEAVAAVVPGAADDRRRAGAVAGETHDLLRRGEPGPLHEHGAGDAELADCGGVDRAHLLGGIEGERTAHASCTMATAAAIPLEWVIERSMPPALTRAAQAAVRPVRLTPGFGRPTISISRQVNGTPNPSALPT